MLYLLIDVSLLTPVVSYSKPFDNLTSSTGSATKYFEIMYIVPIAWLYVALMMAAAEATNTNGTVLGGIITFVLYGLLPVGLVVYLMGAPARGRAIKAKEHAQWLAQQTAQNAATTHAEPLTQETGAGIELTLSATPNAGTETSGDAVSAVREKP